MAKEKESLKLTPEVLNKLKGYSISTGSIPVTLEVPGLEPELCPTVRILPTANEDVKKIKEITIDTLNGKKRNKKEMSDNDKFLDSLVHRSIEGIDNLVDIHKGEVIAVPQESGKNYISRDFYEKLPILMKALIQNEIMRLNGVA